MNNSEFLEQSRCERTFFGINYHPIVYYAFFPLIGNVQLLIPILAKRNFSSSRWAKARGRCF